MRIQFVVTLDIDCRDEGHGWRLFNQKLADGEGQVSATIVDRTPMQTTMLPPSSGCEDTVVPACRNGDTLPCSGVKVRARQETG